MLRAKKPDGLLTVLGGNFRTAPSSPKSAGVGGICPRAQLASHRCRRLPRRRQRPAPAPGRAAPLPAGSHGLPAAAAVRPGVGGIAPTRLTQATPEPPVGISEGSSGEGEHLSKRRKGGRRRGALYLCERAELRNSLRTPTNAFFFWKPRCGCRTPPPPPLGAGGGSSAALRRRARKRRTPRGARRAPGRPRAPAVQLVLARRRRGGRRAGPGTVGQGRPGQGCAGQGRAAPTAPQAEEIARVLPSAPLAHGWSCSGR